MMTDHPTVPRFPNAVSGAGRRTAEPVTIPWRPGVSTVSYAGPRADELPARYGRARDHHAEALQDARRARIAGDLGAHVRAMRRAELARFGVAQARVASRALMTVWFDRTWFYFDDPEYLRRDALMPHYPMPRLHAARSRGEDETYIRNRRAARRRARAQGGAL